MDGLGIGSGVRGMQWYFDPFYWVSLILYDIER